MAGIIKCIPNFLVSFKLEGKPSTLCKGWDKMIPNHKRIIDLTVAEFRELLSENSFIKEVGTTNITPRKINLSTLCETYGFAKATVYGWASNRFIPHSKIGKRLMFDLTDVELWIKMYRVKTKKEIEDSE